MDYEEPQESKIVQWIIKFSGGLVQNKKQANYVLLIFVVLSLVVSFYLFFGGGSRTEETEGLEPAAEAPTEAEF